MNIHSIVWDAMRTAAIWRHKIVHAVFESGDPEKWDAHMRVVKNFYGY